MVRPAAEFAIPPSALKTRGLAGTAGVSRQLIVNHKHLALSYPGRF